MNKKHQRGELTFAPYENLERATTQRKQSQSKLITGIILSLISILYLQFSAFAQVDERTPPPAEENEAQIVAATFTNQYLTTRRIEPLIDRYFVSDFVARINYCAGEKYSCGGFGRDFWQNDGPFALYKGKNVDYRRAYSTLVDAFFLSLLSARYSQLTTDMTSEEYEEAAQKIFFAALRLELKNDTRVLSQFYFSDENNSPQLPKPVRTPRAVRQRLADYGKINDALRRLEKRYRSELKLKKPNIQFNVSPKDFRIYKEDEDTQFFNYSKGTKMFSAWSDNDNMPFKIDMVREKGKLKIVAVYPPID